MLRKTLTVFSLLGLLLSVGAWGVSYFNCAFVIDQESEGCVEVGLFAGSFVVVSHHNKNPLGNVSVRSYWRGFHGFWTNWSGRIEEVHVDSSGSSVYHIYLPRAGILSIPLWLPTLLFGVWPAWLLLPFHRRRNRKKHGLCVKCGYDLRASKDRCPECGEAFNRIAP